MLKRVFVFFFAVMLCFLCVSCKEEPPTVPPSPPSNPSNKNPFTYRQESSTDDSLLTDFYVDEEIKIDPLEAITSYINTGKASERVITLYEQSTQIQMIRMYGQYLEYTSLGIFLFYDDDAFIGTCAMVLQPAGTSGAISTEFDPIAKTWDLRNFSFYDRSQYDQLLDYMEYAPEHHILGISYNGEKGTMVYTVDNDPYIHHQTPSGQSEDFRKIESPVTSIQDGQQKYKDFWVFYQQLQASLPIREWKIELAVSQWVGVYLSDLRNSGNYNQEDVQHLLDYEWYITVPLLDENGNEGVDVLELLYIKDRLIAEVVIRKTPQGRTIVYQQVSPKDPATGNYIGLSESKYMTQINALLENRTDFTHVLGAGFDGTNFVLVG